MPPLSIIRKHLVTASSSLPPKKKVATCDHPHFLPMILFRDNQSLKINMADRPILSQMHIQPIPLSLVSPCSQSIKSEPPTPQTAEVLTDLSGLISCVTMLPGSMTLCSLGRSCFAKLYHQKQHCQQCASSLSLSLSLSSLSSQGTEKGLRTVLLEVLSSVSFFPTSLFIQVSCSLLSLLLEPMRPGTTRGMVACDGYVCSFAVFFLF